MPSFTQTIAAAAAALLSIRREALTPLGHEAYGPRSKAYVGLHTPDTDPVGIQPEVVRKR
jgi:hypothetical protein